MAILGGFLILRALTDTGDRLDDPGPGSLRREEEAGALFPTGDTLFRQRVIGDYPSTIRAYRAALAQADAVRARTRDVAPELALAAWSAIGRTDVGGRVADLSVDPTRRDTLYVATASAGLWISTDAGATFTPSWPSVGSQTMGAVAVSSDGTVFAGTGLPHPAAGFVLWGGTGVFRSADGGRTWEGVGLQDSGAIGRIAVDPSDPKRVYVAAAGSPLREGGERGLYRSLDGGESWELVLAPENETTGAIDVAIDPSDPRRLLTTMWDRDILSGRVAGIGSSVHLSTDRGDHWREVKLPAIGAPRTGRIGVTFAPSRPGRAYAVVANDVGGDPVGLWRSDDGGSSWKRTSTLGAETGRASNGWWFGEVWADPSDHDRLLLSGTALLESTDGGETFTRNVGRGPEGEAGGADVQALSWDTLVSGRVYLGDATGVSRSAAGGQAGTWVAAASQGWNLQYTVEERSLDPSTLGGTLDPATSPAAIAFDESDPAVAYFGGKSVNRTEDGGRSWIAISPDLTTPPGGEPDPLAVVTAIAPPPRGTRVIYAGTSNGLVWRTSDLGRSWDPLPLETGSRWVTKIAVDASDARRAWVALSGYARLPHVLGTVDGGRSWADASGDLPDAPVNDLLTLPDGSLAAATDLGVFVSGKDETRWLALGSNLPTLPVLDIRFEPVDRAILAATFGAGLQRVHLPYRRF